MSDVSASSVYQTLLDEINRGNDLSLQLSQVTFGVPELEDLNVYVDGLTFPGSTWDIGLRHSFHFTDIQGLQLEFYPYENLPNNNGEVPV